MGCKKHAAQLNTRTLSTRGRCSASPRLCNGHYAMHMQTTSGVPEPPSSMSITKDVDTA